MEHREAQRKGICVEIEEYEEMGVGSGSEYRHRMELGSWFARPAIVGGF
jgi:hypothetical protein